MPEGPLSEVGEVCLGLELQIFFHELDRVSPKLSNMDHQSINIGRLIVSPGVPIMRQDEEILCPSFFFVKYREHEFILT